MYTEDSLILESIEEYAEIIAPFTHTFSEFDVAISK
jgi:hypothetical protein